MNRPKAIVAFILFSFVFWVAMSSRSTAQDSPDSHRKLVTRINPEYPSLARTLNVRGVVRVEAVVAPNGQVKTTEIKGGHPVLVQAALNAVNKWRWEPGPKETHELVVLEFNLGN